MDIKSLYPDGIPKWARKGEWFSLREMCEHLHCRSPVLLRLLKSLGIELGARVPHRRVKSHLYRELTRAEALSLLEAFRMRQGGRLLKAHEEPPPR